MSRGNAVNLAWLVVCAAIAFWPGAAPGQDFPSKRISIVTSEAGGAGDFASRIIANGLAASLSQPVVVENRAGLGPEYVAKSGPDGHTLLHYGNTVWVAPLLRSSRWDVMRDFAPVMLSVRAPNVLVVTPSLPVKNVKELVALAKARPGDLNYGASQIGSSTHLAAELFNVIAQVNIVRINYKGVSMAVNDLISGRVQVMFLVPGAVTGHIKAGKLRALAVTSDTPSALLPGIPTVKASGVPEYESAANFGLFAPVKTPAAVVNRVNQEVARTLNTNESKERLFTNGMEVVASTPEQFGAILKSEIAKWAKVIKSAGIREE